MGSHALRFDCLGVALRVLIDDSERVISQSLQTTGGWEANQLALYADLLPPGGVFVDIGANVGINAMFAARIRPTARVVAIEPSVENYTLLTTNLEANGCGNVEAHRIAIADRTGELSFVGSGTNAHLSLADRPEGGRVACHTLDGFLRDADIGRIDLMKIDVEGYTDLVLSRASAACRMARAVILEFSFGDIQSRLTGQPITVEQHADQIFALLKHDFPMFYYIARQGGVVALADTRDLFSLMALEAPVGDVLAVRQPVPGARSAIAFLCDKVHRLMQQNHQRITDILALRAGAATG
jgi:FkbM family methyltransferase